MKRSVKVYLWSWVAVILSLGLLLVWGKFGVLNPHHRLAKDPANIEKITKLDLPDVISVESDDNLDRGASRWDCFTHRSQFAEKLSDDCIRELDRLCRTDTIHWHRDDKNGCYDYLDAAWDHGGEYCISCQIYEDSSKVEYYVDELEGFGNVFMGALVIIFAIGVLVVWGLILLLKACIRKIRRNRAVNNCSK